jgi:type I restriction enzyme, R subunit
LYDFFFRLENKEVQAEMLESELKDKIEELVLINKSRLAFVKKLDSIIKKYNTETHDVDALMAELVDLAKELTEEEQRAAKENLTEEELAVFDILKKETLNPDEIDQVKKVVKEMLEKLKSEKLTRDWREFEQTRAGVKTTITDYIYALPENIYIESECQSLVPSVYNFVYESYYN